MIENWKRQLNEKAKPERIDTLQKFFKTGKNQYGEGDIFLGLTVPDNRAVSKNFSSASFSEIEQMLDHEIHEYRLSALLALVEKYKKAKDPATKNEIAEFYISICHKANNWDLVDLSSIYILGAELLNGKFIDDLRRLSHSDCIWERRVAVVSTLAPVRNNKLDEAFEMCDTLIADDHELINKAVGWVLRECGKKDRTRLENFLNSHIKTIKAVTLSYAIEKFSDCERKYWRNLRKSQ